MDLENFVASTLAQIVRGVEKAQRDIGNTSALVNPGSATLPHRQDVFIIQDDSGLRQYVRDVSFDVAITVGDEQSAGAGAGIQVFGMKLGADGKATYENSSVSRVQFAVSLALPLASSVPEQRERRANEDALRDPFKAFRK